MPKTRVILELGSGSDLHGSDYTKAALRAVQDALHHSSLSFVRTLNVDKTKLDVEVTIGVQTTNLVMWLWIGGLIMALGTAITLVPARKRDVLARAGVELPHADEEPAPLAEANR